jgi:hypothetical protein
MNWLSSAARGRLFGLPEFQTTPLCCLLAVIDTNSRSTAFAEPVVKPDDHLAIETGGAVASRASKRLVGLRHNRGVSLDWVNSAGSEYISFGLDC